MPRGHKKSFWQRHSLSLAAGAVLALWIVLYARGDEHTHWGPFFGNAVADWTGQLIMGLAPKHLYERRSKASKNPPSRQLARARDAPPDQPLTIYNIAPVVAWISALA